MSGPPLDPHPAFVAWLERTIEWYRAHESWWRPAKGEPLKLMTEADRSELRARFEARGRLVDPALRPHRSRSLCYQSTPWAAP